MYNNPYNQFREDDFRRPGWNDDDYFDSTSFGTATGPMPMSAPPSFAPSIPAWREGSRGISSCLFRNTYIWLNNGRSFWFFPTAVGREFVAGFRWSRRYGWRFRSIARSNIRSFECFR